MSYDLYFYKRKNSELTDVQIEDYLNTHLAATENDGEWMADDEDTETYFFIHKQTSNTNKEIDEDNVYPEFEDTGFSFVLNFLRPDFFGIYAFEFVDKMLKSLDLYVINPQSQNEQESPFKPQNNELYQGWSKDNAAFSVKFNEKQEMNLDYFPLEKSNEFYHFNRNKSIYQQRLGTEYFVPKIFLMKRESDGKIVTAVTWPEHIPSVIPNADYYILFIKTKFLFFSKTKMGVISAETLNSRFADYLDDFEMDNCKIIYPGRAAKVKKLYNSTPFEFSLDGFASRVDMSSITNYQ